MKKTADEAIESLLKSKSLNLLRGDSDDFSDLNGNGIPDYIDENGSGEFEFGETIHMLTHLVLKE